MRRIVTAGLIAVTAILGTAGAVAATSSAAAHDRPGCGTWSGSVLPYSGGLTSVVAFSPCDVWAAGYQGYHSMVVHWNGSAWSLVSSGVVTWNYVDQSAVTIGGTSDRDLWLSTENAHQLAVVEHWNGTRFSAVSLPLPAGTQVADLEGISAVSRRNVWAAGFYSPGELFTGTLVEHWNGHRWSIVPSPDPSPATKQYGPGYSALFGVSASRHAGAWAVGQYFQPAIDGVTTATEHWDGRSWTWVTSPRDGRENQLFAVSADSRSDAWAVGYYNGNPDQALVEHWNGTAWQQMAFPDPGEYNRLPAATLWGVAALSPSDVWVAGGYPTKNGLGGALLANWNGTAWQQVTTPVNPATAAAYTLFAISAPAANDIWSVGLSTAEGTGAQQAVAVYHG